MRQGPRMGVRGSVEGWPNCVCGSLDFEAQFLLFRLREASEFEEVISWGQNDMVVARGPDLRGISSSRWRTLGCFDLSLIRLRYKMLTVDLGRTLELYFDSIALMRSNQFLSVDG